MINPYVGEVTHPFGGTVDGKILISPWKPCSVEPLGTLTTMRRPSAANQ